MRWLWAKILQISYIHQFIEWSKTYIPPGFKPLSLYTVGVFFFDEIQNSSVINRAASLSYSFILAIFPTIIFIFTLIPFVPIHGFQDQLLSFTALILPKKTYAGIESTIFDIVKNQNGNLLSFGFFSAIFFATNGTHKLMVSFNKASLITESRTWLKQRLIAITLTTIIAVSIFLCIGIMVGGEFVINFARKFFKLERHFIFYFVELLRWSMFMLMYLFTISLLYKFGPSHRLKLPFFSPGAWLATFLAVFTFIGFAFYINKFGRFNKVYGSIGTLIVIMIWMNLNAYILLIGYELNASIEISKRKIKYINPYFNYFKQS